MLEAKSLPKVLWAEAVNTAVYILNRTSSTSNTLATPYEVWHGNKPDVAHLRVFGSDVYTYVDRQFRGKFDSKAEKGILVGYEGDSSNYRIYYPQKRTVLVSKHVKFHEESSTTMELKNTPEGEEEEELKFQANPRDMQDLEEREREVQGVPDRVIAGEQGAAGQAGQSVASQG